MSGDYSEPSALQDNPYVERLLRRGFHTQRTADGDTTASILRYTESGGNATLCVAPTGALVAGLSNLQVSVSVLGQYGVETRDRSGAILREGEREFAFLDIPAANLASGKILGSDFVSFEGRKWRPLPGRIGTDPNTGESWATCVLVER